MKSETVIKLSTVLALITSLAGGWMYLESHFALASDLETHQEYTKQVEQSTVKTIKDLRIQIIADQLNEIDMKENLSPNGLTKWDKIRQESLKRQWEMMSK